MKTPITLTEAYQPVSVNDLLVCSASVRAEVYIGSSTSQPASSVRGFPLNGADLPYQFSNISLLGGNVWVKGTGQFNYASDI